jgi:hypothetical protein
MEPLSLLTLMGAGWLLLHAWLLPLVTERWKADPLRSKMARAGTLAVLEKLRDLLAVGFVSVTLVALLVFAASSVAKTSTLLPKVVIEVASGLYEGVKSFGEAYGSTLGGIGFAGLALTLWLARRQARRWVGEMWTAQAQKVYQRLYEDQNELRRILVTAEFGEAAKALSAANEAYDAAATDEERQQQVERTSRIMSGIAIEVAAREVKFEEAIAKSANTEAPKTRWAFVVRILTGKQFAKDIGLLRKPLSYVTTGLLMMSLVSWAADPMADSLRLAVNNLRIVAAQSQVHRELTEAVSRTAQAEKDERAAPATPEVVRTTARMMGRVASYQILSSRSLEQMAGLPAHSPSVDAEFVRAAITGDTLDVQGSHEPAAEIRAQAAHEIAQSTVEPKEGRPAVSGARQLEEHVAVAAQAPLETLNAANPGRFSKLRAAVEARYAVATSPLDAQGKLMEKIVDQAFEPADIHPADELGKQAQKLIKEFGKTAVQKWVDTSIERFVTDTLVESVRGEVRAALEARLEASEQTRQLLERLRSHAPGTWVPGTQARQESEMAARVADEVARRHNVGSAQAESFTHSLRGYDVVFARDDASPALDLEHLPPTGAGPAPEVKTPGRDGGGVGGGGALPTASERPRPVFERPVARSVATSFRRAAVSFRVRGVLVGQDQEGALPTISDLRWALQPGAAGKRSRLTLELMDGNRWVSLGDFDGAVVNQALRYAADRRVVATTITPGDGQVVGRLTYLHPALIDTPLGCRVVEADRFIDTFTMNPRVVALQGKAFQQLSGDRFQMAEWLRRARIAEAVMYQRAQGESCPSEAVRKVVGQLQRSPVNFGAATRRALDQFIASQEKRRQGSTAFLRQADACAARSADEVSACWCSIDPATVAKNPYWMPEDHTSQFRERVPLLDAQLNWLGRSSDRLGMVDLWVHTTFSMHAWAESGPSIDEGTAAEFDFPSDELEALRVSTKQLLGPYLSGQLNSPSYEDFMGPLEDFVRLQRLMRAALDGRFAPSFPLQKLGDLQKQTRGMVAVQPTIRWEAAGNDESTLVDTLTHASGQAEATYARWRADTLDRHLAHRSACDLVSR